MKSETKWYLPKGFKQGKDNSQRYVISETQMRMFYAFRFAILDFNTDQVREFIKWQKLKKVKKGDV